MMAEAPSVCLLSLSLSLCLSLCSYTHPRKTGYFLARDHGALLRDSDRPTIDASTRPVTRSSDIFFRLLLRPFLFLATDHVVVVATPAIRDRMKKKYDDSGRLYSTVRVAEEDSFYSTKKGF